MRQRFRSKSTTVWEPLTVRIFIGAGNNPMVGATVAVAVAIEEACK